MALEIGVRIRESRRAAKLTQAELANRIGKTLRTVQKYESGEIVPSITVIHDIARILGVPLDTVIGYRDNSRKTDMAYEPQMLEQLRKEWMLEAERRGFFAKGDLISRKALLDGIGSQELFALLSKEELRECGCHFDEDGEFYFTEEQWRIMSALLIAIRRYINTAPTVDAALAGQEEQTK